MLKEMAKKLMEWGKDNKLSKDCRFCNGLGERNNKICPICHGRGYFIQ